VLIRRAEVDGAPCDVRVDGERIVAVAGTLDGVPGEPVLDAAGGALLPGLHDHHVHLLALAAAERSVACGPPGVSSRDGLAAALRGAATLNGWVRGVGYHESVAGPLDRDALDRLEPERPVRIQHRSGAMWIVNSAGVESFGLDAAGPVEGIERDADGRPTGRLLRLDGWLRDRLGESAPPDLASVGACFARFGVTGLTDATPGNGASELDLFRRAVASGALPQRLALMGREDLPAPPEGPVARGAVKLLLAEHALPEFDALVERIRLAHEVDRPVAVHCVTRAELVLTATALATAGSRPGDRIEHASVAPPDVVALLRDLPVTIVTQPNFIRERGDAYARDVDAADRPWLYRCAAWLEAGVPLGGGTDAPFGDPDPWKAMRSAVERETSDGRVMGASEALAPERALALFTTPWDAPGAAPRRIAVGEPADLCLLDAGWSLARRDLSSRRVRATIRAGRRIHGA
jgi:predicted amidohydrolase YtcJ